MESTELIATLRSIGFRNLQEYFQSPQYALIKQEVLLRDAFRCRAKKCNQKAESIVFVAYTLKSLTGQHPHLLLSVCDSCLHTIAEKSKNDPTHLSRVIIPLLLKLDYTPGKSNPAIGRWYRNQFNMNVATSATIQSKLNALPLS